MKASKGKNPMDAKIIITGAERPKEVYYVVPEYFYQRFCGSF